MKLFVALLILSTSVNLISMEIIGKDSGQRPIELFKNDKISNTAILFIGGIHGDEVQTVDSVKYLKDNLEIDYAAYYIPSMNPTLLKVQRRGYLRNQLNSSGHLLPESNPQNFNKELYYRVFYGNNNTYKNGINYYIDPNRDFIEKFLPSTRILIELINNLKTKHDKVIILSFHGYMTGGKIYPDYRINSKKEVKADPYTWSLAKAFENGSSFKAEKIYSPSIPIIERFKGELVAYTGNIQGVFAMDVELNSKTRELNNEKALSGVKAIILQL